MKTIIRPFKSLPNVTISCPCDLVYRVVAKLDVPLGVAPRGERARRAFALSRIAYSLAGVRRGNQSAEEWAAQAQKQINDIVSTINC